MIVPLPPLPPGMDDAEMTIVGLIFDWEHMAQLRDGYVSLILDGESKGLARIDVPVMETAGIAEFDVAVTPGQQVTIELLPPGGELLDLVTPPILKVHACLQVTGRRKLEMHKKGPTEFV